jgi:hypothetical protein
MPQYLLENNRNVNKPKIDIFRVRDDTTAIRGDVLQNGRTGLIGFDLHETGAANIVQGATFRAGDHHFVRASLSPVYAELA